MKKLFGWAALLLLCVVVFNTYKGALDHPAASPAVPVSDSARAATRTADVARSASANCKGKGVRAHRLAKIHADWTPDVIGVVACNLVQVGLTAAQLTASFGKPYRVDHPSPAKQADERWRYGEDYIYLTDGVVTSLDFTGDDFSLARGEGLSKEQAKKLGLP